MLLYGKTGNVTEAANILTELEQLTKTKYVSAYAFALVQAGLGNRAEALRWLEKCYADRSQEIGYVRVDRLLDPLRDDPRFQNLGGRVFPVNWNESAQSLLRTEAALLRLDPMFDPLRNDQRFQKLTLEHVASR